MLDEIITILARRCLALTDGVESMEILADSLMAELHQTAIEPPSVDELIEVLRQLGSTSGPLMTIGELVADLIWLSERLVFTHRITEAEIESGELALDADLAVLARISTVEGGPHTSTGEPIRYCEMREPGAGLGGTGLLRRSWIGPPGWLDRFAANSIIQVSMDQGLVHLWPAPVVPATEGTTDPGQAMELAAAVDEAMETSRGGDAVPVFVEELQVGGMLADWYEPKAGSVPFGEVLESAGLEMSSAWVGRPGGWEAFAILQQRVIVVSRHMRHIEGGDTRPIDDFFTAFRTWKSDETVAPEPRALSRLGRSAEAALCVEEEMLNVDPTGADLNRFLLASERPKGALAAALDTLRALATDLAGNGAEAEALLATAVMAAPEWYPALEGQAFFLDLRGRAQEAANVFQRTRMANDEELAMTRRRATAGAAIAGRNDPCPCGSGRKFKQCHSGKNALPPDMRVTWLLDKARGHLTRLGPLTLTDDLLAHRSGMPHANLIAIDLALFDRGALAAFLAARSEILPAEDVALLTSWVRGHHASVFRVTDFDGEGNLVLTDQATAKDFTVNRTRAFNVVAKGDVAWCRLLPDGDRWWCSGIVRPVKAEEVDMLLAVAGDPERLCQGLTGLSPTVPVAASDGGPLMMSVGCWRLSDDQATVEARLGEVGLRQNGEYWVMADEDGTASRMNLVSSSGAEDGAGWVRLLSHTDSVGRHHAAEALVATIWPDVPIEWEQLVPIARHRALRRQEELIDELSAER